MNVSAPITAPVEVFYIVQSTGIPGQRTHRLRSDLYETRPQAEARLAELRHADSGGRYSVWKSATYIEPAEWLHRVVRADGTLILPRLQALRKSADA
jgi:hypothetical protein